MGRRVWALVALLLALVVVPALAATIGRGQVSDLGVTGGAAVFTSSLTAVGGKRSTRTSAGVVTDPGEGVWWNITVTIKSGSTASKVYLRKIVDGDTTFDEVLNENNDLVAGARYGFSTQVHPDHTWNIVFGTTTHAATVQVEEEP